MFIIYIIVLRHVFFPITAVLNQENAFHRQITLQSCQGSLTDPKIVCWHVKNRLKAQNFSKICQKQKRLLSNPFLESVE